MLKKLLSHTVIYGLAPQIPRIASVFALPIITLYLTELDFGVFGLITAIAGGLAVLNTLGLNVVLSNYFYRSPYQYKWLWRQIYGFLILWNIPYAFILSVVIYLFIPVEASGNTVYIIALNVIPIVLFGPTAIIGSLYYQLSQKPLQIAVRSIIIGMITVGLNVFFIAGLKMGYLGWFLSICISQLILQFSYYIPVMFKLKLKPIYNFKWRLIKRHLKVALPTVPHYYSSFLLNSSDRIVMGILGVPTSNIGLYNASSTVSNLIQSGGLAAGKAVSPLMLQAYRDNNDKDPRSLIFVLQIVFLCGTFILSIWLKEIFILLIKNKTLQSVYPIGIILIMAYNYRPMYLGANNKLFYLERTKELLKISFFAGISNVILNFIFIPIYGYEIAAYTTYIALMYMGYSGFYLKVFKENCNINYHPIKWLFLTIILTVLVYFIVELSWSHKVSVTIFALIIALLGIKKSM